MYSLHNRSRQGRDSMEIDLNLVSLPANVNKDSETNPYPGVRFWKQSDWIEWKRNAEYQELKAHGTIPYLEKKDGQCIDNAMAQAIKKTMRAAFTELSKKEMAPATWGRISTSGKLLFKTIMESAHPLFKYSYRGWKLEHLATNEYSQWKRNHLNTDGTLIDKSKRKKTVVKKEEPQDDDLDANDDSPDECSASCNDISIRSDNDSIGRKQKQTVFSISGSVTKKGT